MTAPRREPAGRHRGRDAVAITTVGGLRAIATAVDPGAVYETQLLVADDPITAHAGGQNGAPPSYSMLTSRVVVAGSAIHALGVLNAGERSLAGSAEQRQTRSTPSCPDIRSSPWLNLGWQPAFDGLSTAAQPRKKPPQANKALTPESLTCP